MRDIFAWLLDEKVILGFLSLDFMIIAMVLINWQADKDYVMVPFGLANLCVGALLRGIVHSPTNGGTK